LPVGGNRAGFVYLFEGGAQLGQEVLNLNEAAELSTGEHLVLSAGDQGAAMLILAAEPIGEPIAQYGPFVMNTVAELDQAIEDYQRGRLV
jgi:redox-sensitive bicupin YhaK (pirin superfamily)